MKAFGSSKPEHSVTDGSARPAQPKTERPPVRIDPAGELHHLGSLVTRSGRRRVVVLADPSHRADVDRWLAEFKRDRVVVLAGAEHPGWGLGTGRREFRAVMTLDEVDAAVRQLGRVDVVVSLVPPRAADAAADDQLAVFRRLFRSLAVGGMYVVDREAGPRNAPGVDRLTRLVTATTDRDLLEDLGKRDRELAKSVGAVLVTRERLVATKRLGHFLKLRDADVDDLLARREPELDVTTVQVEAGGVLTVRADVHSHGDEVTTPVLTGDLPFPAVTARHYQGRIASSGGMLLYTGGTVLPDSFRWHLAENPTNINLTSVSPSFGRIPAAHRPKRHLAGSYYSIDSIHAGHFGHLTSEVISRFWGWDQARQQIPDLKMLFHVEHGSDRHPGLELALTTAYGVDPDDVVWVDEPVWVESLVAATPMWHNESPHYAHPGMQGIWTRLTDSLLTSAPTGMETHERIFVSRSLDLGRRRCHNQGEVEEFFAARGFTIVLPETLSLPEQAALFSEARVVAGFGGSAMFNLMHARRLETTIVLSHDAYTARNENLFCAILGGQLHYFWSAADRAHPEGGFSRKAVRSAWAFDFDRFGGELDTGHRREHVTHST